MTGHIELLNGDARLRKMADGEFLQAFNNCTINATEWTHEAHIRMAFLLLQDGSFEAACVKVREGIQRLNAVIGVQRRGYHETITLAYMRVIAHRLQTKPGLTWEIFKQQNTDLLRGSFLESYYSLQVLDQPSAKEIFVEPDLKPLS